MIKKYIFSILLIMWAQSCFAYICSNRTASTQAVLSSNNISIARNLPVGSEIVRATTGNISTFNCVNSVPYLTFQYIGIKAIGNYVTDFEKKRIYSTNIAGIGYAVYGETDTCNTGGDNPVGGFVAGKNTVDGNPNNAWLCSVNGMFTYQPIIGRAQIVFYKTADVTGSGTVSVGNAASFFLQNDRSTWVLPESLVIVPPFTVSSQGCDIKESVINVNMGSIPKNRFDGFGSSPSDYPNTKNFKIGLTCNANTRINLQINGQIQSANQGLLSLTSSNKSAKGVAIQILDKKGVPLVLGQPLYLGNSNANGIYNISLFARYVQVSNITPGVANSTATFTITYQ